MEVGKSIRPADTDVRCVPISVSEHWFLGIRFGAFCDFPVSGAECDCNNIFMPRAKHLMTPI
jgi:hypothetical protein